MPVATQEGLTRRIACLSEASLLGARGLARWSETLATDWEQGLAGVGPVDAGGMVGEDCGG